MSNAMARATAALRANPFAKTPEQALLVVLAFLDADDPEILLAILNARATNTSYWPRAVVERMRSLAEGKAGE